MAIKVFFSTMSISSVAANQRHNIFSQKINHIQPPDEAGFRHGGCYS